MTPKCTEGSLQRVAAGTQLIARRFGYRHHGIYVGNGCVIHYVRCLRYPLGLIEEIPLTQFTRAPRLCVGRVPCGRFGGADVVTRARSRLGERRYDLWGNNCEHFANWAQSGEHRSLQVESLSVTSRLLIAVLDGIASKLLMITAVTSRLTKARVQNSVLRNLVVVALPSYAGELKSLDRVSPWGTPFRGCSSGKALDSLPTAILHAIVDPTP
jgi:hypothetical protein